MSKYISKINPTLTYTRAFMSPNSTYKYFEIDSLAKQLQQSISDLFIIINTEQCNDEAYRSLKEKINELLDMIYKEKMELFKKANSETTDTSSYPPPIKILIFCDAFRIHEGRLLL